jgi:hypothetical protein
MRVTESDMESRKRMAALQSDLTDTIAKHAEQLTYVELVTVLADAQRRWLGYMLKNERDEENGDPT